MVIYFTLLFIGRLFMYPPSFCPQQVWLLYTCITATLLHYCTRKKLDASMPRRVYSWFLAVRCPHSCTQARARHNILHQTGLPGVDGAGCDGLRPAASRGPGRGPLDPPAAAPGLRARPSLVSEEEERVAGWTVWIYQQTLVLSPPSTHAPQVWAVLWSSREGLRRGG